MSKARPADTTPDDPFEPVELDPPSPALTRWDELLDRDTSVYHEGDIEKMMPFPRPSWSDPDEDLFSTSLPCCLYRATPVRVAATRHNGRDTGDEWTPAGIFVQPAIGGTDVPVVRISFSEYGEKGWNNRLYMALTASEAIYMVDVLQAAIDLLGSEK